MPDEHNLQNAVKKILSDQSMIFLTGLRPVGEMRQAMFIAAGVQCESGTHLFIASHSRVARLKQALMDKGLAEEIVTQFMQVKESHEPQLCKINLALLERMSDLRDAFMDYLKTQPSPMDPTGENRTRVLEFESESEFTNNSSRSNRQAMQDSHYGKNVDLSQIVENGELRDDVISEFAKRK